MESEKKEIFPAEGTEQGKKSPGQVISFVAAKGGVGKTIFAANAAYLLLKCGKSVIIIDTDFSTHGISLFMLGEISESGSLKIQKENSIAESILEDIPVENISPFNIIRDSMEYKILFTNRYLQRVDPIEDFQRFGSTIEMDEENIREKTIAYVKKYFDFMNQLCERLRHEYDYVIIDTRGGFDYLVGIPAIVADEYVVIVEADKISLEQISALKKKIDRYARRNKVQAKFGGFIINKAIHSVDDELFPTYLEKCYNTKVLGTIPLDPDVIEAYQKKRIPSLYFQDCDFSNYSIKALNNLASPSKKWKS